MGKYVELLDGLLDPFNYGYASVFIQPGNINPNGQYSVPVRRANPDCFDCVDSSIMGMDKLREYGIDSEIWVGMDEMKVWRDHYFLVTEDDETVDLTPLFPTEGAKHKRRERLNRDEIEELRNSDSIIFTECNGLLFLYYSPSEDISYVSRIGVLSLQCPEDEIKSIQNGETAFTEVFYEIDEIVQRTPIRQYALSYRIDKKDLYEIVSPIKSIRKQGMNFSLLEEMGIVEISEDGFRLPLQDPKMAESHKVGVENVVDLREFAEQNDMQDFRQFVVNTVTPLCKQALKF